MRFKIDNPAILARRFRLADGEHSTPPAPLPEIYKPVKAPEWGAGLGRETYKRRVQAQTPKRTSRRPVEAQMGADGLVKVRAPVGPRKGRRILEFTAASEYQMPGFMGSIELRINRDSVDMGRLELGLLSLALDHDASKLMGRITEATIHPGRLDMEAEVGDTPVAKNAMSEIDDLMRAGFSPGFLILESEMLSEDDPGYDADQFIQIVVTRFEPYEISSTAIPRSPDARLKGVASMGNVNDVITGEPELVSREDPIGLSLVAGREVLRKGSGSERQRAKLREFFKLFDAGRESGLARDVAARAAKLEVGL